MIKIPLNRDDIERILNGEELIFSYEKGIKTKIYLEELE